MRKFEWYKREYNYEALCNDFVKINGWLVEYDSISFVLTKIEGYWMAIECSTGLSVTTGHNTRKACDLKLIKKVSEIKDILFSKKHRKEIEIYQKEMEDHLHDYPLFAYADRRGR